VDASAATSTLSLIEGSYVYRKGTGIGKVPANGVEGTQDGTRMSFK